MLIWDSFALILNPKMSYAEGFIKVMDYVQHEFPPGPACIKLCHAVNFQKCNMPIYLTFLMWYFNNYSEQMMVYAVLHGTYGICWYMKHLTTPDAAFERYVTIGSVIVAYLGILGPYCIPGYLLASGQCE